jgi:hypothetical protein
MTFLEAVASFEGFGKDPKNRPTRNNNPGNVSWGEFARRHGATRIEDIPEGYKTTPRYAYFPDAKTGFAAMKARFSSGMYQGLSVHDALHKWAPPVENDTAAYVRYVCQQVGCSPDTVIDELL